MNCLQLSAACIAVGAAVGGALPSPAAAADLRDPMRPPAAMRASLPGADLGLPLADRKPAPRELDRLVAIRNDDGRGWQALLGERWLGVGDRIDRYTVSDIAANTVQLAEGRNRRTLTLLPLLQRGAAPSAEPAVAHPGAAPLQRSQERPTP
jgi:hypothetical protein